MTVDVEKAMDSAEHLSRRIDDIDYYISLSRVTFYLAMALLVVVAIVLLIEIFVEMVDFQQINYSLWSIYMGGYGAIFGGTFTAVPSLAFLIGTVFLYFYSKHLIKIHRRKEVLLNKFDRSKGKDELVRFIAGIDWSDTLSKTRKAKISFGIYSASIVGVNSVVIFAAILLFFAEIIFMTSSILSINMDFLIMVVVSIVLSITLQMKSVRSALSEFRDVEYLHSQLRMFVEEFQRSAIQA